MTLQLRTKQSTSFFRSVTFFLLPLLPCCVAVKPAGAAAVAADALTPAAMTSLEEHAATAQPREQCFLYTQLLQRLTEIEGQQLADGDETQAAATLTHLDAVATKLHSSLIKDAKKLKEAEMLMEHSTRRLSDMLHVSSSETRARLQTSLQHLNAIHSELLSQVFAQ